MATDYKTLLYKEKDTKVKPSARWWELDKAEVPAAINMIVEFLNKNQTRRQTQLITSARLYGNVSMYSLLGSSNVRPITSGARPVDRVTYNVCSSVVDTITSKIAKNKPKPFFLTSGGDWKLKRKAQKLTKFVDGCFYENDMYQLGPEIFRDGCVWGDGVVHVYAANGKIKCERVFISELYVDEMESIYGKPRQLHRAKNMDRQVLLKAFPKSEKDILETIAAKTNLAGTDNVADQITVFESWHLPSGPKAKDGKHVITINNAVLLSEPYTKDHYPFAFFKWSKRLYGFYAQGLIEQIQNIQLEINKLLWVIQRSMHLAGTFKLFLENGSKVVKEHLNNDIGSIINYTGAKPEYVIPPIVPPEIYQHVTTLKNAAYEQAGVSQLSANSQKPAGLNSGKALREYNDIESDRFMLAGQAYEQFFLDVADLMIDAAKEIYEDDKAFSVNVPGKKFVETIKWKDVNMEEDQYIMQCFPVSKLPDEPAGRLQTVVELMQAGLVSPDSGRRLLNYPDLESEDSLAVAQEDLLHKILEEIVEDEKYTTPEPYFNLALAEKLVLEYLAQGHLDNLEQEKMNMLNTFKDQVQLMAGKYQPQAPSPALDPNAPPAMPDDAAAAMGNPTATPTAELLQNTNNPVQ